MAGQGWMCGTHVAMISGSHFRSWPMQEGMSSQSAAPHPLKGHLRTAFTKRGVRSQRCSTHLLKVLYGTGGGGQGLRCPGQEN